MRNRAKVGFLQFFDENKSEGRSEIYLVSERAFTTVSISPRAITQNPKPKTPPAYEHQHQRLRLPLRHRPAVRGSLPQAPRGGHHRQGPQRWSPLPRGVLGSGSPVRPHPYRRGSPRSLRQVRRTAEAPQGAPIKSKPSPAPRRGFGFKGGAIVSS